MIKEVHQQQFIYFYSQMKYEFPPEELKSLDEFFDLLKEGKYRCFGYFEDKVMVAFCLGLLTEKKYFWLDYLLVFNEYQSTGIGTKFLKALLDEIAINGIFLETEVLDTDDYHDKKQKRMRFYDRFNIQQIDCKYLFPCTDGTYIETLNLDYIPPVGKLFLSKEEIKEVVRESVTTIHKALPHHLQVMNKYIDTIHDLNINYFTLEDVNMDDEEEIKDIGRLIYYTDPYVYPAAFDNDINLSIKCAKAMLTRDTLFNHKNIKLGKINGKTAGFMVILDSYPKNNHEEMIRAMKESIGQLTPRFEESLIGYFDTLDYEWEGIQIMSLAVLPEFRQKKVATKMLNSLPSKNTYSLACVKDNLKARELYRKCGFEYKYEYPGFTDIMCVELVRKGK